MSPRFNFLNGDHNKQFLVINLLFAVIYFVAIAFFFEPANTLLFSLLIAGEIFHLWQILGYTYTVWNPELKALFDRRFSDPADVYITVAGEPVEIVERTALAALAMNYPNFNIYLLNDGYMAKKDNWQDMESLAVRLGIGCITRTKPGGAKAGNINNALSVTHAPYIAIFDADHAPHPNFLREAMGYFTDEKMGFVQTPQYYRNQKMNMITDTAWNQQSLFFGPIMRGKNRLNSAFMCGTNLVIRRKALEEAGGMCEFNIAEDFLTSLFVHQKGWKSVYVPEVLAEGLAPEDFLSYYKQQYRWARGSLEVIFKYNPLFRRGLTWAQRFQYLISASYYLSGIVVLIDALIPIVFLFTGASVISTSSMALAFVFLPYIFLNLYVLQMTSNYAYTYRAISFSLSSFYLQIHAVLAVLLNRKTSFSVTSKQALNGNFIYLALPHLAYIALALAGGVVAYMREGLSAALFANAAWVIVNIAAFMPFIIASLPTLRKPAAPRVPAAQKVVLGATAIEGSRP